MNPQQYLEAAGLASHLDPARLAAHAATYAELAEDTRAPVDVASLYRYRVPELGEGGACSLPDVLAPEPYDLAITLGGTQAEVSQCLAALGRLVQRVVVETGCGWLGIYQARARATGPALVKLAYRGKPSRAEFPLSVEFAAHSNNSAVGLSGQARVIDDVTAYLAQGGAYYTCDSDVRSEACLPMFDTAGAIVGIVDAEDARSAFFTGDILARVAALCLVAAENLPPS